MPPSNKYNRAKDAFLGMPTGTACSRLRKLVLFSCVQQLGQDDCFRCGKKILSPDDFSLEHKKSWLNVDRALFWDLSNISFSHLRCNVGAVDRTKFRDGLIASNVARRKIGPAGTAWCARHREFLPIDQFHRNRSKWNGLGNDCGPCATLKERKWR